MRRKIEPLLRELHAHTRWSDGAFTVAELVDLYGRNGFDVLCVTDHVNRSDDPWLPADAPARGIRSRTPEARGRRSSPPTRIERGAARSRRVSRSAGRATGAGCATSSTGGSCSTGTTCRLDGRARAALVLKRTAPLGQGRRRSWHYGGFVDDPMRDTVRRWAAIL